MQQPYGRTTLHSRGSHTAHGGPPRLASSDAAGAASIYTEPAKPRPLLPRWPFLPRAARPPLPSPLPGATETETEPTRRVGQSNGEEGGWGVVPSAGANTAP